MSNNIPSKTPEIKQKLKKVDVDRLYNLPPSLLRLILSQRGKYQELLRELLYVASRSSIGVTEDGFAGFETTREYLSGLSDCCHTTVSRFIRRLEEDGLIEVRRSVKHPNIYRFIPFLRRKWVRRVIFNMLAPLTFVSTTLLSRPNNITESQTVTHIKNKEYIFNSLTLSNNEESPSSSNKEAILYQKRLREWYKHARGDDKAFLRKDISLIDYEATIKKESSMEDKNDPQSELGSFNKKKTHAYYKQERADVLEKKNFNRPEYRPFKKGSIDPTPDRYVTIWEKFFNYYENAHHSFKKMNPYRDEFNDAVDQLLKEQKTVDRNQFIMRLYQIYKAKKDK